MAIDWWMLFLWQVRKACSNDALNVDFCDSAYIMSEQLNIQNGGCNYEFVKQESCKLVFIKSMCKTLQSMYLCFLLRARSSEISVGCRTIATAVHLPKMPYLGKIIDSCIFLSKMKTASFESLSYKTSWNWSFSTINKGQPFFTIWDHDMECYFSSMGTTWKVCLQLPTSMLADNRRDDTPFQLSLFVLRYTVWEVHLQKNCLE